MLNYDFIVKHINECVLANFEMLQEEEKGDYVGSNEIEKSFALLHQIFLDSLPNHDDFFMTYNKFVTFNRGNLIFEYEAEKQDIFLKSIGKKFSFDVETCYYKAIYPVFKVMYDDFIENVL